MDKIRITIFTDPMMGLSYECEPVFRKLETHFADRITFCYNMGMLVRDVHDFMIESDYADTEEQSINNYNARLATIYMSEEDISGMPINMDNFCLFSKENTSSKPLNLAFKAAQLAQPELAEQFLYNLRYATIVETRPTTRLDEIINVVRSTGINEQTFLKHYRQGTAEKALTADLERMHQLGIHYLPACLLEYGNKQLLVKRLADYDSLVKAIALLTEGSICPLSVEQSLNHVRLILERHPVISPIELREAFDFATTDEVNNFIQPLIDNGEITIRNVRRGCFIVKN